MDSSAEGHSQWRGDEQAMLSACSELSVKLVRLRKWSKESLQSIDPSRSCTS